MTLHFHERHINKKNKIKKKNSINSFNCVIKIIIANNRVKVNLSKIQLQRSTPLPSSYFCCFTLYMRQMDINDPLFLTPDECHPESLHAASGRIMLEEHTSFIPMVAQALEFYLCDDTMFYVQLWEPMEGRKYKLVWSKDIIPDENSGGGHRRTVFLLFLVSHVIITLS